MSSELSGQILLNTLWAQDSDGDLVFNTYCPMDLSTNVRSLVGCVALMHAQILYYWAAKVPELSLTLSSADAYRTSTRRIYISGEKDTTYDYGVFTDINAQLADISVDTTDDIAALCYACGVLVEADYTSSATSASMTDDVYVRAGFDSFNIVSSSSNSLFYTTTGSRFSSQTTISDAGWEIIQDNLLNGLVIAVASSAIGHALVMDGYDAGDGTYHLNFGWGSDSEKEYSSAYGCYIGTGWYTETELEALSIYSLGIDLYPVYDGSVLTVTDTREYGVGTLYRVIEQASNIQDSVTIDVSESLADASISLSTALPSVSHDLIVNNLYGDIRIQLSSSDMPGMGTTAVALSSDTNLKIANLAADFAVINGSGSAVAIRGESSLVIDNLSGVVAANTYSTSYALYSEGTSEIALSHGGIFAGKYTVSSTSGESAITNIFTAFDNFEENGESVFSAIEICATGYAVYSGDGDDTLTLTDESAILGCIYLADGENAITVESGSYLHSYILASANTLDLTLSLKAYSDTPLLSMLDLTVSNFRETTVYYGIEALISALDESISVDVSQAETGTYTLLTGAEEDACGDLVFDLGDDIQLSLNGTRQSGVYALAYTDDGLTLSVKGSEAVSPITITAGSASKMYDGAALTNADYTFTDGILAEGDNLVVTVEGTITNAGTVANHVTSYAVMRGNEDVTSLYSFADTIDGVLTVTKRDVILTSASDTKVYDGTPLTNSTITVSGSGFVEGEGYSAQVTGTQTNIGASANMFTYTLDENTNADNYSISTIEGTLTVTSSGREQPPDIPSGGGGEGGEGGGGGSSETVTLTGAVQVDSGNATYNGEEVEENTFSSTTSDENVVLAQNDGTTVTISNYTLNKTGDCTSEDNSNFYAVNAVVAAANSASVYIDNCELISDANGANSLFATGEGSTIYAYNCTITSEGDSSRGLDATYEGTVIGSKLTITTSGDHCGALATDRGNGYISVTDSELSTAGQGSPVIYSTGIIEVDNVIGEATGAQIAGIEGLSTIRIKNSDLTGSGVKASEPVANGVIIYQSNSGDSTEGTATFEVSDSTLKSEISSGAMFYVTNTSAVITVQNTTLDFDTTSNYLLKAAGNDGSNGWGTAGSNGATVTFTLIDQEALAGDISVDGISYVDMYLINSDYTGTFVLDTTYTGDGGATLSISSDSTWVVTESCTLNALTVDDGATIVDESGDTVSIVNTSGKTLVSGESTLKVTVAEYSTQDVEPTYTISEFEIDRTSFEAMYGGDTPQIQDSETEGYTTVLKWGPADESTIVDVALSKCESSDETLLLQTTGTSIELYSAPEDYDVALKYADGSQWSETTQVAATATEVATSIVANENNVADLFFANVSGTWEKSYQAQHQGSVDDWSGTSELVVLLGKNKIADTFTGSSDANILYLTDDDNGDALFVDDTFTENPGEQQARISQINEIRAGAGDDIVDMTSQSCVYTGDGLTIRGGSGDDTIWANKGDNLLFGDAGNDRLVGASGNDIIAGGIGNDSMHGGGGEDVFCFGENWGTDTVEQLSDGKVTLWFVSGSESNWDQETMTYSDGTNSVTVTGVTEVTLKFDDSSEEYATLASAGCFMDESSDKNFETTQKGVLAVI